MNGTWRDFPSVVDMWPVTRIKRARHSALTTLDSALTIEKQICN